MPAKKQKKVIVKNLKKESKEDPEMTEAVKKHLAKQVKLAQKIAAEAGARVTEREIPKPGDPVRGAFVVWSKAKPGEVSPQTMSDIKIQGKKG